jgi:hypothetical protein
MATIIEKLQQAALDKNTLVNGPAAAGEVKARHCLPSA